MVTGGSAMDTWMDMPMYIVSRGDAAGNGSVRDRATAYIRDLFESQRCPFFPPKAALEILFYTV